MKQISLVLLAHDNIKKRTKREKFLNEMEERVAAWDRMLRLVDPHSPKAGGGRQPTGLQAFKCINADGEFRASLEN